MLFPPHCLKGTYYHCDLPLLILPFLHHLVEVAFVRFLLYVCVCVCGCVLVAQSCLIVCNPGDYSPPGSSVHGILQARMENGVSSDSLLQGFFSDPGMEHRSPALQADSLPSEPPGKPFLHYKCTINVLFFLSIVYSFGKSLQRAYTHWRVMLYLLKG